MISLKESSGLISLVFTCLVVSLALLAGRVVDAEWYQEAAVHAVILGLLVFATRKHAFYSSPIIRSAFLLTAYVSILGLQMLNSSSIVLIYSVMLVSMLSFFFSILKCSGFIALNSLLYILIHRFYWDFGLEWQEVLIWASFHVFAMLITQRLVQEENAKEALAHTNRQLASTQLLLRQSAVENERLYMARELHDNVGHQLTALILQLDIARRGLEAEVAVPIDQCYTQAKALLQSIREVVSDKRHTSDLELKASLQHLFQDLPRIQVDFECAENFYITDVSKAQCLLRCTQEMISNVLKHSAADMLTVNLSLDKRCYRLSMVDNGGASGDVIAGNGLKGMLERCELFGGSLEYRTDAKGFHVDIELPK